MFFTQWLTIPFPNSKKKTLRLNLEAMARTWKVPPSSIDWEIDPRSTFQPVPPWCEGYRPVLPPKCPPDPGNLSEIPKLNGGENSVWKIHETWSNPCGFYTKIIILHHRESLEHHEKTINVVNFNAINLQCNGGCILFILQPEIWSSLGDGSFFCLPLLALRGHFLEHNSCSF